MHIILNLIANKNIFNVLLVFRKSISWFYNYNEFINYILDILIFLNSLRQH